VFFAYFITAPYAASNKQPIFFGCLFEWRLADNIQRRALYHHVVFDESLFEWCLADISLGAVVK